MDMAFICSRESCHKVDCTHDGVLGDSRRLDESDPPLVCCCCPVVCLMLYEYMLREFGVDYVKGR